MTLKEVPACVLEILVTIIGSLVQQATHLQQMQMLHDFLCSAIRTNATQFFMSVADVILETIATPP